MTTKEQAQEEVVRHLSEKCSVEISRGQKGSYGWTVKVRGDDDEDVMTLLKKIDGSLRASFNTEGG